MTKAMPARIPEVETGRIAGVWPYAKLGAAPRSLIVFPGIHDALQDVTVNPRFVAWFARAFAADRTVYMISRRDGIPPEWRVGEMAADYGDALSAMPQRMDIMGVSLGSAIAQEFALAFPERIGRLILATAGCRLLQVQRQICEQWREPANRGAWREVYLSLVDSVYGRGKRLAFESLVPKSDAAFAGRVAIENDFLVSVDACLDFDTTDRISAIQAKTLVIGGEDDRLMPAHTLRDLAERIPDADLTLIGDAGHGVFEEKKDEFDQSIISFLNQE